MDSLRKRLFGGIILGSLVGFAFAFGGFLLVRGDSKQFGWVMFLLVPVVTGFAVATVVRRPKLTMACCICGLILTISVLLVTGLEGVVCCLMASPLVGGGIAAGAVLGHRVRERFIDRTDTPEKTLLILLSLCPLFLAAADRTERPFRAIQQRETFMTETVVSASRERTWDLVARMHRLDGPRPFLLRIGLPVPQSCSLDRESVGGQRVCHFDNGLIAQEVTEWKRPEFMAVKITKSTLPGRHWLTYLDASYELFSEGDGQQTRIVRKTAIGTRLYPRWYWRPLERVGVTSEHDYVFSNLQRWTKALANGSG